MRGRRGLLAWTLGALIATVCASTISAMVVEPASFSEMVAGSHTVIHGRVIAVEAYETAGRRTIESRVTVHVDDVLKGAAAATTYFTVPGGQVGRYRRVMVGAPSFSPGEEVVLFLTGRTPAVPRPFGMTQGIYRVRREAGGRATVAPTPGADPGRIVRGDPARRPLDLQVFMATVRVAAEKRQ